ncbi:MAG: hypothetical protein KGJ80_14340 [Chloroflexota bacterium]|nr:hypothetical protein [Chloroflexota bacterium]
MKKVRETKAAYVARSERVVSISESAMNDLNEMVKLESAPLEEVLTRAVTHYRHELGHRKIEVEVEAYRRKHPRLRARYLGEYIAMHNGRVVDHDRDGSALYWRVRSRFARTPVLVRQVTDEPGRVIRTHGLRLERGVQ